MVKQVNVSVKNVMEICEPLESEGGELRAKEGRRDRVTDDEVRKVGEGLEVKDRGRVHPAGIKQGLCNRKIKVGVFHAEGSSLVGALITIDTRVPLNPGEFEQGVMAAKQAEEILEHGTKRARGGELEQREVWPAIALHCEEATTDEAEDKSRVSVDVQVGRLPCLQGHDDGRYLSYVVGHHGPDNSGVSKDAGVRVPSSTGYTGLETVVDSGAVGPDSDDRGQDGGCSGLSRDRGGTG